MKTKSERLFEDFCNQKSICCTAINQQSSRTPDYWISIPPLWIVVEVKEFRPNKEDKINDQKLQSSADGKPSFTVTHVNRLGSRAQNKITKSAKQISNLSNGKHPGLLVLYNPIISVNPINPYELKVAMFGLETIDISCSKSMNGAYKILGRKFGTKKKFTKNSNTSISAVAVLTENSGSLDLVVYHNPYAAIPIPPTVFKKFCCRQLDIF